MSTTKNAVVAFILLLLVGMWLGILLENQKHGTFSKLSRREKHQKIISERDLAIQEAMDEGEYKCCINPPCTMCYMEANQWNNYKAGTCACDDLIAQGKEPCPQCKNGLCETSEDNTCKIEDML